MVHYCIFKKCLHKLTDKRCKTNWSVVLSNALRPFLVDSANEHPGITPSFIVLFSSIAIGNDMKPTSSFDIFGWNSSGPQDLSTFNTLISSSTIPAVTEIVSKIASVLILGGVKVSYKRKMLIKVTWPNGWILHIHLEDKRFEPDLPSM